MNVQFFVQITKGYMRKDSIGDIYNQANFLNETVARIPFPTVQSPGCLSFQSLPHIFSLGSSYFHHSDQAEISKHLILPVFRILTF